VDTNLLATTLAAAGAGVAVAPLAFVAEDLAAGRLVQEGRVSKAGERGYHLVSSAASAAAGQFLNWVADTAA
jgi:DNA-binding transcriptional LysR family regulator